MRLGGFEVLKLGGLEVLRSGGFGDFVVLGFFDFYVLFLYFQDLMITRINFPRDRSTGRNPPRASRLICCCVRRDKNIYKNN